MIQTIPGSKGSLLRTAPITCETESLPIPAPHKLLLLLQRPSWEHQDRHYLNKGPERSLAILVLAGPRQGQLQPSIVTCKSIISGFSTARRVWCASASDKLS